MKKWHFVYQPIYDNIIGIGIDLTAAVSQRAILQKLLQNDKFKRKFLKHVDL